MVSLLEQVLDAAFECFNTQALVDVGFGLEDNTFFCSAHWALCHITTSNDIGTQMINELMAQFSRPEGWGRDKDLELNGPFEDWADFAIQLAHYPVTELMDQKATPFQKLLDRQRQSISSAKVWSSLGTPRL